jgi:CTP:molybdopterin cytidylyltransferase MocA
MTGEEANRSAAVPADARLFAIVLAAGSGRRFGAVKQLAMYEHAPLVARALRLAESVCGPRTVLVAGHEWRAVVAACRPLQGFFTNNTRYTDGMGGSIACGVRSVIGAADAVLIMLADQPLITVRHLERLAAVRAQSGDVAVVTSFAGTDGPPVIFPRRCFAELSRLEGDRGARPVLDREGGRTRRVVFEAAAADVDVPDDLNRPA